MKCYGKSLSSDSLVSCVNVFYREEGLDKLI